MLTFLPILLFAYLLGSLSSAILVAKALGLPDPRQHGSNNPGATNMLRLGGKKAAILTLMGDMLKGFLPCALVNLAAGEPVLTGLVWLAAFMGHLYPVFFQFKGGKGIATFWGGLFGFAPWVALAWGMIWLVIAAIFKKSSLAALFASSMMPMLLSFIDKRYLLAALAAVVLIFWRHRSNIQRLWRGEEPSIQLKK